VNDISLDMKREAQIEANDQPMADHADGCPYLIYNRRRNCRCFCYDQALNERRLAVGLPRIY
jgi:hypothetical protein